MTDLPPGWARTSLGEVLERIETGKSFSGEGRPALPDEWGVIKVSAMTYGSFRENENKAVRADTAFSETAEIKPGDLLLSRANTRDYVGASVLVGSCRPRLLLSDKSLRLVPTEAIDRGWLWYALSSPTARQYMSNASSGVKAGMRNISQDSLRSMPLTVPPLEEQRRIVAALEDHLSRVDVAARYLASARGRLTALVGAMRNVEIGDPSDNKYGHLADVLDRIEAGKSFGGSTRPAVEGEWGIIKVSAMTWGEFRSSENKFVPDDERVDPRYEIRPGDILVSRANTAQYVGAPVLVRSTRPRLLLSDKSLRLVPKLGVDRDWLIEILASPLVRKQVSKKATGTKDSMRNISQASLKEVRIPLHEADRQREVAAVLAERREAVQRMDSALTTAAVLGSRLRHSLLTDAFIGRLVPQNPDDEPASVLLERIRVERQAQQKSKRAWRIKQPDTVREALP